MATNVTGNFPAAGGMADVDCVLQIKFFSEDRKIIGVGVHIVAVPGLGGAAVPSTVRCYDPKALLAEKSHLSVPVVRGERPAVTEHYGLAFSPVLVINLRTVFGGDGGHRALLFCDVFSTEICADNEDVLLMQARSQGN